MRLCSSFLFYWPRSISESCSWVINTCFWPALACSPVGEGIGEPEREERNKMMCWAKYGEEIGWGRGMRECKEWQDEVEEGWAKGEQEGRMAEGESEVKLPTKGSGRQSRTHVVSDCICVYVLPPHMATMCWGSASGRWSQPIIALFHLMPNLK